MTNLEKMLRKITKEREYLVTSEQAEEYLKELLHLESELNVSKAIIRDTKKLAQEGLKALAPLYSKKENKNE